MRNCASMNQINCLFIINVKKRFNNINDDLNEINGISSIFHTHDLSNETICSSSRKLLFFNWLGKLEIYQLFEKVGNI